jgi:16S rRNA (adenine1518-N6/adenine1519-N6)-dimethyltransferase
MPDEESPLGRPRKRLGQHFLTDRNVLARIADAAGIAATDTVVEIGPGRGSLTDILAERAARVIGVELDRDLVPWLRARYADRPHVTIVEGDFLELATDALADGPYVLVGNVPYYITTPIIFKSLAPPRPVRSVFLVQSEVAERIVSPPGSKAYGALSVNVQAFAEARLVSRVRAGAFTPAPSVDSAILRLTPRSDPAVGPAHEERFRSVVQGAFALRRKQMLRVVRTLFSLGAPEGSSLLESASIDPMARPETLSAEDFARQVRAQF